MLKVCALIHEEADTQIVIYAKHAINLQFGMVIMICWDIYYSSSVMLVHWMLKHGWKPKKLKCFPVHFVAMIVRADVEMGILRAYNCM